MYVYLPAGTMDAMEVVRTPPPHRMIFSCHRLPFNCMYLPTCSKRRRRIHTDPIVLGGPRHQIDPVNTPIPRLQLSRTSGPLQVHKGPKPPVPMIHEMG